MNVPVHERLAKPSSFSTPLKKVN